MNKGFALSVLMALLVSGCAQTPVEKTKKALALHAQADERYAAKDCEVAINLYQEIVRDYPEAPESWFRIGNCHARLKQDSAAVAAYRQALSLNPEYGKAWHNLIYVESQSLAATLRQMDANVKSDDPARRQVSKLIKRMLDEAAVDMSQPVTTGVQASALGAPHQPVGR